MKRIKIGNNVYKIVYEDGPLFNNDKYRGYCDEDEKTLHILKGMKKKITEETIVHEILHAIEEEYGIVLPHKVIYDLEEPLNDLIKANFRAKRKK